MQKQYEELLAALEEASGQARAIHEGGDKSGAAERTYQLLQRPIWELRQRVKSTRDFLARQEKAKAADKAEAKAAPGGDILRERAADAAQAKA
jgi:hypothetical protein